MSSSISERIEPINFCSAARDLIGTGATDPSEILASVTTPLSEEIDTKLEKVAKSEGSEKVSKAIQYITKGVEEDYSEDLDD